MLPTTRDMAFAGRLSVSALVVSLAACGGDSGNSPQTITMNNGGAVPAAQSNQATPASSSIRVISSRSDTVSGGDALIEVTLPPGIAKKD
ncbi:DUF6351 family protein, partial [Noviherbaspirillum sp.]|uniref:DUF6351 family protein n=1 Tax=Noviherbaspirillum sp. TaxID=1926288 RepID=UPI002FE29476